LWGREAPASKFNEFPASVASRKAACALQEIHSVTAPTTGETFPPQAIIEN
jgi:hypothetical protein